MGGLFLSFVLSPGQGEVDERVRQSFQNFFSRCCSLSNRAQIIFQRWAHDFHSTSHVGNDFFFGGLLLPRHAPIPPSATSREEERAGRVRSARGVANAAPARGRLAYTRLDGVARGEVP